MNQILRIFVLIGFLVFLSCSESVHRRNLSPFDPSKQSGKLEELAAKYFPNSSPTVPAKQLFRLTRSQLDRTVANLLNLPSLPLAMDYFPGDPLETNYEYASHLAINSANFASLTGWVDQVAQAVLVNPSAVIDCSASGNSPTCLHLEVEKFVRRAFRGDVTPAKVAQFVQFFDSSLTAVGLNQAVADLVRVVLNSPQFLFRYEVFTQGQELIPAQRLQNISYTLSDSPPEQFGWDSTQAPILLDSAGTVGVRRVTEQVLASSQSREKLMRFFMAWLEVREPGEYQISKADFPEFTPAVEEAVTKETAQFLLYQLNKAAPSLKDVTQSNEGFVSDAISFIYGSPGTPKGDQPVKLDPAQRLGVFSQSAVIASHSGPTTTRLIKRGVFFVRKVMCLPLGEPQDGNLTLPNDSGTSQRQKVQAATNQPQCLGCHSVINPMGFFLESYNPFGKWQDRDNGVPVDASISTSILDSGPFSAVNTVDSLKAFTSSVRFEQCFVRQVFRYYMGRPETPGDDPVLKQMFLQFSSGDQNILSLLTTLANSDRLSARTEK